MWSVAAINILNAKLKTIAARYHYTVAGIDTFVDWVLIQGAQAYADTKEEAITWL